MTHIYYDCILNSASQSNATTRATSKIKVCVYNICVCSVYNYFAYINTHTCMYIFKKNVLLTYKILIFIFKINYV